MSNPTGSPTTQPLDDVRQAERADEAKTADGAPAPVHSPRDRKVLVRDAHGEDPYGEPDAIELGQSPHELPDPLVDALRDTEVRGDGT